MKAVFGILGAVSYVLLAVLGYLNGYDPFIYSLAGMTMFMMGVIADAITRLEN